MKIEKVLSIELSLRWDFIYMWVIFDGHSIHSLEKAIHKI
jgi:hypothetical protein